jgi:hypothetical protein
MTDAATDALIAKLCAEESNPYYDSFYVGAPSDEELSGQDSDYGSARKKKPKGGKRGGLREASSASAGGGSWPRALGGIAPAGVGDGRCRGAAHRSLCEDSG